MCLNAQVNLDMTDISFQDRKSTEDKAIIKSSAVSVSAQTPHRGVAAEHTL